MKKKLLNLINLCFIPVLFVIILWVIKGVEINTETNFSHLGLIAKNTSSVINILTFPLIHGGNVDPSLISYKDFEHLINNSFPIMLLGSIISTIYKEISNQVFFFSYLFSGGILWFIGNPNENVIGASGLVFSLASFIVVSGFIRKSPRLSMISFLIIFIYGNSLFWGMIPMPNDVSWEGHLAGFIAGTILSIIYKNKGPKEKKYDWEIEEENTKNLDFQS